MPKKNDLSMFKKVEPVNSVKPSEPKSILAPKTVEPEALDRARDLGTALAEGIAQGIF